MRFLLAGAAFLAAAALHAAPCAAAGEAGWPGRYLRAGVVLDDYQKTRFTDANCTSTAPAALYGCGEGINGQILSTLGNFETAAGLEVGLGYAATPHLRVEALLQYRPDFTFRGRANFLQTNQRQEVYTEGSSLTGLLAVWADAPPLSARGPRPFLGGGIGFARLELERTHMHFTRTTTVVPRGQTINPAWMVSAGFALDIGRRMTLDLAWRYTDYGEVETDAGQGLVLQNDGSRAPLPLALGKTQAHLTSHGVGLSLRYRF